jgi:hypothetical protein
MSNPNQPSSHFNLHAIAKSPVARVLAALAVAGAGVSAYLWETGRFSPKPQIYTTAWLDERYRYNGTISADFDPAHQIFLGSNRYTKSGEDAYVTADSKTWTKLPLDNNQGLIIAAQFSDAPSGAPRTKGDVVFDVSFVDKQNPTRVTSELFAMDPNGTIYQDGEASGTLATLDLQNNGVWAYTPDGKQEFILNSEPNAAGQTSSVTVVENS